jgi:hypothetical protein
VCCWMPWWRSRATRPLQVGAQARPLCSTKQPTRPSQA